MPRSEEKKRKMSERLVPQDWPQGSQLGKSIHKLPQVSHLLYPIFFYQDLIIEAIYADIIHGKLDQKNKQVEVEYALGRDIKPETIGKIADILQEW